MYCTALDLIGHANRARLIGQLAGSDYAVLPSDPDVLKFFETGIAEAEHVNSLTRTKARVEQAIANAAGEINGYLALFKDITLPADTLKAACIDMAMFRLCEQLDENSVIKQLYDQHIAFFDKLATKKLSVNTDADADAAHVTGSAETVGSPMQFSADKLEDY